MCRRFREGDSFRCVELVGSREWLVLSGYHPEKRLSVDPGVVATDAYIRAHYLYAGVLPITADGEKCLLAGHRYRGTLLWGPFAGAREEGEGPEDTSLREAREESGGDYEFDLLPPTVVVKALNRQEPRIGVIFPSIVPEDFPFFPNPEVSAVRWCSWGDIAELFDFELDVGGDFVLWGSLYTWAILQLWLMCVTGDPRVRGSEGEIHQMMHRVVSVEEPRGIGGPLYDRLK